MTISALAAKLYPHAQELRHQLHQNPELGNKEIKTSELIRQELTALGIEMQALPGMPTAVTAVIYGGKPGKTVGIREDIDALPLVEETGLPYASTNGAAHACGHDIHCATLLLTAAILQEKRAELAGNVRLIFQPAEELASGALDMLKAGIMELEPKCDTVIGLHCSPEFQVGHVGFIKGAANASTDLVNITVVGKGGHGAHPYRCVDPIVTSAYMLTQLQTIVSRENPAVQPAVLTFGSIHGGTACNIIPTEVKLTGTLRAFNEEGRHKMWEAIKRVAQNSCEAMRATAQVEIIEGVPSLQNAPEIIDGLVKAATATLGADKVHMLPAPSPGSDDISCFCNLVPGAQFRLGSATHDPNSQIGLHNPKNIFGDEGLQAGAAVMAQFTLDYLK